MDVVVMPQLGAAGSAGGGASRYRLLEAAVEGGSVQLTDRCVTRFALDTADAVKVVFPPKQEGFVRDFFVRLVITADTVPEVTFAPLGSETISFEDADEDVLTCEIGVNVFAFTETDAGVFMVNRKQVDIEQEVAFDGCGGDGVVSPKTYKLGAKYGTLQSPVRDGYVFDGWFTQAEGGTQVTAGDTVKTGVTKLYAHWSVYVDPYVDAICPAKNLTFYSSGNLNWIVDTANYHTGPASARSGRIADSQSTILKASFRGAGTLSFWWKVSSEDSYDELHLILDGSEAAAISGETGWAQKTLAVSGDGLHTVQWKYDKDSSVSNGSDCGWVDDVAWTPAGA